MDELDKVRQIIDRYRKLLKYSDELINELESKNEHSNAAYHKGISHTLRLVIKDFDDDLL